MSDQQTPTPGRRASTGSAQSDWSDTQHPQSARTAPETGTAGGPSGAAAAATDAARDVAEHAAAEATQVKDTAAERGAQVVTVAKEEFAQLTSEARTHVRSLWSQASEQVRTQADTGRHQLADLLHSLAGELGEMASKSSQDGPVTALAKQAAARGGELSHWLANAESADVLVEIRRFARRRPFVFLGGAAVLGVVVGRLSRGLMAADGDGDPTAASGPGYGSVPATTGVTSVPPVSLEEVPDFGAGEAPAQPVGYPTEDSSVQPLPGDDRDGGWR